MRIALVAVAAVTLLGACSNTRRCESVQSYQKAETLAAPAAVPGLTIPQSPSALNIPPPPANDVPFGKQVADPAEPGKTHYECLDAPPQLVVSSEPAAAAGKDGAPPPAEAGKKKRGWWPW